MHAPAGHDNEDGNDLIKFWPVAQPQVMVSQCGHTFSCSLRSGLAAPTPSFAMPGSHDPDRQAFRDHLSNCHFVRQYGNRQQKRPDATLMVPGYFRPCRRARVIVTKLSVHVACVVAARYKK
jgi:hypothetical protein